MPRAPREVPESGDKWATSVPTAGSQVLVFFLHACVLSHFSRVDFLRPPWTVAKQSPLSMGFSRREYWSGLPCPPPGNLSDAGGLNPHFLHLLHQHAGSLPRVSPGKLHVFFLLRHLEAL